MSDAFCEKCRILLDAYHDGELDSNERLMVEQHLQGCESCRLSLLEIRLVVSSLQTLPVLNMRKDIADDIGNLLQETGTGNGSFKRSKLSVIGRSIGIAAAVILLVLSLRAGWLSNVPVLTARNTGHPSLEVNGSASKGGMNPGMVANSARVDNLAYLDDAKVQAGESGHGGSDDKYNPTLVALYGEPGSVTEDLGITTDEDGLYALKM